jgi:hypothetical protein
LPSISCSTSWSCWFQIQIQYSFGELLTYDIFYFRNLYCYQPFQKISHLCFLIYIHSANWLYFMHTL